MVESNEAILANGHKLAITASSWTKLLELNADPDKILYVREIKITFNDFITAGFQPYLRVDINGSPKIREWAPLRQEVTLNFGGDLVFRGKQQKPPITIYVKSDGTNSLNANCVITGVETPLSRE